MGTNQYVVLFAAVFLIVLPLLFWAVYIRKPGRRRSRHHHTRGMNEGAEKQQGSEGEEGRRQHRHRHHRHEYPRNPTLAETGGLPPIKPQQPPAPEA